MREIKFRLWDNLKKEMLFEGFHVFGEVTMFNAIGTYAYETRGERASLERYNDFHIMQFTGLHDKNGKEIYENDIVKMTSPYGDSHTVCEIRFINGGFVVEANGWFGKSGSDLTTVGWAIEEEIEVEVIGNIHESHELLNK